MLVPTLLALVLMSFNGQVVKPKTGGTTESSMDPSLNPGLVTSAVFLLVAEGGYYVSIQKGRRCQAPNAWLEIRAPGARRARARVIHHWTAYKRSDEWKGTFTVASASDERIKRRETRS